MAESILESIVRRVRKRMETEPAHPDLEELALDQRDRRLAEGTRSFRGALSAGGASIIAECKKASPSAGVLRDPFDPVGLACSYEAGGASAISVVVERDYFSGRPEWIPKVRDAVALPVMRKDFIISRRQLLESVLLGADAVLLIQRILSRTLMEELVGGARELGLDVLLEIFVDEDPGPAVDSGAEIIGVNARNLATFETRVDLVRQMAREIPSERLRVAESGIRGPDEVQALHASGFDAMLIGESLLRAEKPEKAIRALLS